MRPTQRYPRKKWWHWAVGRIMVGIILLLSLPRPTNAQDIKVHGARLFPELKPMENDPNRFRSTKDWETTLLKFQNRYKNESGIVFRKVEAAPGFKFVHIQNTNPQRSFDGINMYEARGKVYVYVLARKTASK